MIRRLVLSRATIADLRGRLPVDPDATTRLHRIVLNQERGYSLAEAEDAMSAAVRDYRALHLAVLEMLARCPSCACGAVATVVDHAAKRDACDACHTGTTTDRPWAEVLRTVASLTTLPGTVTP
jgi:hypothetical protein